MKPRPMAPADAPALAELLAAAGFRGWDAEALAEIGARPDRSARVADAGEHQAAVGVALAVRVLDEAEIVAVVVAPRCRQRGIGRALVGAVLDDLRSKGVERVFLEVRARNQAARGLYRTLGFSDVGLRRGFYGDDDAVLMARRLGPRPDDLSLVILAGGRGRRLGGVTKPLLRYASDETLLARALRVLGPVAAGTVVVAPADVQAALGPLPPGVATVADDGLGPPAAVAKAAGQIDTGWLALVAGDLVAPDAGLLRALAGARTESLDAVIPVVDGFEQPLFGVYRTSALRRSPPRSMRAWLADIRTERVAMTDERGRLSDVDTFEDVQRFGLKRPGPKED